ncbi:hypothetical protein Tco_0366810 [Tanacetum coccineum]
MFITRSPCVYSPSTNISSPAPTPTQPSPTQPSPQPSPIQPSPTQLSPTQPGPDHHPPTPHDSPLHAVHSHGSDEGSLKLQELMNLINTLSDRIGVLEADLTKTKQTYSSAYTKLILRVKKLEAQIKVGKAKDILVWVQDDEGVHEKASTETELFIQEVTPTEVIHEQEGSGKASDEVSTAGKKKDTASEEVPPDKGKAILIEEEPKKKSNLPKGKESACAKPHHMIAPGSSRYSSNDMVHNHYLEEAKKKTQEHGRNSIPSVMPSARSTSTANGGNRRVKFFKTIGLRWVPTRQIFTSSTTKVDGEPTNGSNEDITNQYECEQTLDVSASILNLSACTSFNPKKEGLRVCSELAIQDHSNEPSSSKLVPKVVPLADKTTTSQQEYKRQCCSLIPAESDSLPHAHAQTTKTYYKHQDSRIKKAQVLKIKTSANSDKQDLPLRYQGYQGRLLASF